MTTYTTTVQAKTEALLGHVLSDTSGLTTTIMASIGDRLGTMGMPESKVRALCTEAGCSKVQRVPMENPFNSLYEVTF